MVERKGRKERKERKRKEKKGKERERGTRSFLKKYASIFSEFSNPEKKYRQI